MEEWLAESNTNRAILELARTKPRAALRELYTALTSSGYNIAEEDFLDAVALLVKNDEISLEDKLPHRTSFPRYLVMWYLNSWLYAIMILCAVTLLAVYLLPGEFPAVTVRWASGSVLVLFLPGFVSIQALFPKKEIDDLERLALSIGLSLAIVALIALVLNYTPWGIRLNSTIAGIVGYSVTVALGAAWRKFNILNTKSVPLAV